jgi:hypothetical protein
VLKTAHYEINYITLLNVIVETCGSSFIFSRHIHRLYILAIELLKDVSNIDYLMVLTACLVCFISTVNGHSKKEALEDRI